MTSQWTNSKHKLLNNTLDGKVVGIMLRSKKVEFTPEVKIDIVNGEVEKQQEQFKSMLVTSEMARITRENAIEELEKEVSSLMATLKGKKAVIERAHFENQADLAFEKRIAEFLR